MGGCYSHSYYSSPCSRVTAPEWQTQLRRAIKNKSRAELAKAYNSFFNNSNSSGFILEVAKELGIKSVNDIPKEFPEIEYEIKFDIQTQGIGSEPKLETYLDAFDFPAPVNARFLKDPVNNVATGLNRFYGTDSEERLVVITKGNGTYLKEKSEFLPVETDIPLKQIVLKRKEDRRAATIDEVTDKIVDVTSEEGVKYRGKVRKEKGDAFILDSSDGRIYSFTITRSHLIKPKEKKESEIQRQLEIEYAGYLPISSGFKKESEEQIVSGMIDLARYTYGLYMVVPVTSGWRIRLIPTLERKFDFVAEIENKFKNNHREIERLALTQPVLASLEKSSIEN